MSEEKTYDLSKVHEANLKLLKEIDRICQKYKIKYALDSGTLLGAIRHGGFIPWDDDVDVVMTRANYEMFAKVVRRELTEGMTFVEPNQYHNGEAFFDFVPRILYDKSQKTVGGYFHSGCTSGWKVRGAAYQADALCGLRPCTGTPLSDCLL